MEAKEGVVTISDESVKAKTGKTWSQWFKLLDKFGGKEKGHKLMAKWLADEHGVTAWWAQTITVQYERARGMRKVNERVKGFALSVSRTVDAPLSKAWNAWARADELSKWFTTNAKQDFKEGGRYANADKGSGTFLKIVPKKTHPLYLGTKAAQARLRGRDHISGEGKRKDSNVPQPRKAELESGSRGPSRRLELGDGLAQKLSGNGQIDLLERMEENEVAAGLQPALTGG